MIPFGVCDICVEPKLRLRDFDFLAFLAQLVFRLPNHLLGCCSQFLQIRASPQVVDLSNILSAPEQKVCIVIVSSFDRVTRTSRFFLLSRVFHLVAPNSSPYRITHLVLNQKFELNFQ